ncbi:hypothetical protein [Amycolatopsis cihanbeyliensis]|uniref:Uncharacterized protein n=1 Tax=Amycolatopsis cihanbeyliensis TaxID=1128664 RepID=A0A542DIH2_AMYCI|nr:hypothetical protein [Amycolatopsis cihanbeyliensis]TQJ02873.1 hypothetical protein FB471_2623 [Amycolatopsis cihanbeyliensis]
MGTIDEATAEHGGTPIFAAIRDEFGFTPPSQEPEAAEAAADSESSAEATDATEDDEEATDGEEDDGEEAGRHRGD